MRLSATEQVELMEPLLSMHRKIRIQVALFSISDNGKGIPLNITRKSSSICLKNWRTTANASGIGLALVKKIVNYYKGEIYGFLLQLVKARPSFLQFKPKL